MGHVMWRELDNNFCNHDPKIKVKSEKNGCLRWCTIDCILFKICFVYFSATVLQWFYTGFTVKLNWLYNNLLISDVNKTAT